MVEKTKTVGIISCTKTKQDHKCKAKDMYILSALFKKAFKYCKEHYDEVYILSAKHHLLLLDTEIEPYNETVNEMNMHQKELYYYFYAPLFVLVYFSYVLYIQFDFL